MPHTRSSAPAVPGPPATEAFGYAAGQVVAGKYELTRLLGSGGMGAVWAVRNLVIDAEFALKMLRNDAGDAHAAERMLREARSAARIEHPAIVRVFDFGVSERGDPFLVMDLLHGTTVRELLLQEGRMNARRAAALVLPIADALSVAHTRDVVHRDVKTDNLMIVPGAHGNVQPTLVDFGIAKQLHSDSERLTLDGTVVGSPEYMSPEQVRGLDDVDHTTDVWSLSVVLFEMVTGHTPFHREGGLASVLRAITDEPPTTLAAHGIQEPDLQCILDRGLSKFPKGRFPDMRAFGTALARFLLAQGVNEDASGQSIRTAWFDSHASAPPVAIDASESRSATDARRSERQPRLEPSEGHSVRKRGAGWPAAVVVSLMVVCAGLGAGLYARGRLGNTGNGDAVSALGAGVPFDDRAPPPPLLQAAPVISSDTATPAASTPVVSAVEEAPPRPPEPPQEPVAEPGPPRSRTAVADRTAPRRRARLTSPATVAAPVPAPAGLDVTDLPTVFAPPAAGPPAPPAASTAPARPDPTPPEAPSRPRNSPDTTPPDPGPAAPGADDLRDPYPEPR